MGRRPGRLRRGDHGSKAIYCVLYDIVAHDQEWGIITNPCYKWPPLWFQR
eukprot:NODE_4179_length_358_cov_92.158576_g3590_i0.p2 GENE.NODE_4179_length_358_cov_92.158576_g3590_i0~~NODE_4179_length_358_cov_92.158576_g3590_i0.p2  ORF type:complete len:60 (+),score=9.31 NODE_4179_length_358_cov_92.158576_g3590_i0:32-181(+)